MKNIDAYSDSLLLPRDIEYFNTKYYNEVKYLCQDKLFSNIICGALLPFIGVCGMILLPVALTHNYVSILIAKNVVRSKHEYCKKRSAIM
jgi:hypothetical protein